MSESSKTPETKFFLAAPQGYIVTAYIIVQVLLIIIGIVFPAQALVAAIISFIALIVTIAIVFMLRKSVNYVKSKEDKVEAVTDWRKDVLTGIEVARSELSLDNELLSILADEIKFSDPVSNESTASIEVDISRKTKSLPDCSDVEGQIEDIRKLISRRNSICKLSK